MQIAYFKNRNKLTLCNLSKGKAQLRYLALAQ
jgi:hypothetical protein